MIGDHTLLRRRRFLGCLPVLSLGAVGSARAETVEFDGASLLVYRLDPKVEKLELFLLTQDARRSPTFEQLDRDLSAKGKRLKVAMNAGIYEPGFRPSGLHIADGKTFVALNTGGPSPKASPSDPTPNFYLLPNGVFFIRQDGTAGVLATQFYATSGETPRLATQSGPLLLAGGKIHPVFREGSPNRLLRNGIGVDSKGRVVLVSSVRPPGQGRINFFSFARLFRDQLDCQDALYLDGDISHLHIRGETGEAPPRTNFFAGVLAVVEDAR
jgi:uncharacterized protein YigE (DUF2233 family)